MKRGLFITVEGIDGSGKTTQMAKIQSYLESLGCKVLLIREPGGTRISEAIRGILLNSEYTEMLLYSASRAQLVEETIKPAIGRNITVICDRFVDSFYAYQGYGRGSSFDVLTSITNFAIGGTIPDITLFFDIAPEIALRRRFAATESDRIENEVFDFHKKVYDGFKALAAKYPGRIKTIDATRSEEEVWRDVRRQLDVTFGFIKEV
jgi:dTMP kinase